MMMIVLSRLTLFELLVWFGWIFVELYFSVKITKKDHDRSLASPNYSISKATFKLKQLGRQKPPISRTIKKEHDLQLHSFQIIKTRD